MDTVKTIWTNYIRLYDMLSLFWPPCSCYADHWSSAGSTLSANDAVFCLHTVEYRKTSGTDSVHSIRTCALVSVILGLLWNLTVCHGIPLNLLQKKMSAWWFDAELGVKKTAAAISSRVAIITITQQIQFSDLPRGF